jgi:hypothetical protein
MAIRGVGSVLGGCRRLRLKATFGKSMVLTGACAAVLLSSCTVASVPASKVRVSISPASAPVLHATDQWPFTATLTNTDKTDVVAEVTYTITGPTTSVVNTVSGLAVPANSSVTNSLAPGTLSSLHIGPGTNTVSVKVSDGNATATSADQPQLKVYYDMIVIDTYHPTVTFAPAANYIDLFDSDGDTSTVSGSGGFNLWAPGGPVTSPALAHDDGTASLRPVATPIDYTSSGYAYAQYAPPGGLTPGLTFYIRSRMLNDTITDTMPYAIRVLTSPGNSYSPADLSVSMPTIATTDDPAPLGGMGVPSVFTELQLNQPVGRYLSVGGVHWSRFSLP